MFFTLRESKLSEIISEILHLSVLIDELVLGNIISPVFGPKVRNCRRSNTNILNQNGHFEEI